MGAASGAEASTSASATRAVRGLLVGVGAVLTVASIEATASTTL